jgi:hypothetical protein
MAKVKIKQSKDTQNTPISRGTLMITETEDIFIVTEVNPSSIEGINLATGLPITTPKNYVCPLPKSMKITLSN